MSQYNKSMAYDHPQYVVRQTFKPPANVAGASKVFDKFVAWTTMVLYSFGAGVVTAGTSTYTAWNGTATVTTTGTGDTLTGLLVKASGGTTTYGPFAIDAAAGGVNQISIGGTATVTGTSYVGTAAMGGGTFAGIALALGDQFSVTRGTDATAVQTVFYEYGHLAGGNVTL